MFDLSKDPRADAWWRQMAATIDAMSELLQDDCPSWSETKYFKMNIWSSKNQAMRAIENQKSIIKSIRDDFKKGCEPIAYIRDGKTKVMGQHRACILRSLGRPVMAYDGYAGELPEDT